MKKNYAFVVQRINLKSATANNMAIKPKCNKCGKELKEFGAILLSPPKGNIVKKFHLCKKCYRVISQGLDKKYEKCHGKKNEIQQISQR